MCCFCHHCGRGWWYNFVNVNCCASSPCILAWIVFVGLVTFTAWYLDYSSRYSLFDGDPHRQLDVYLSILWTISYVASLSMIVFGIYLTRQQSILETFSVIAMEHSQLIFRSAPFSLPLYKHMYPCDETVQAIPDPDQELAISSPDTDGVATRVPTFETRRQIFETTFALELFRGYYSVLVVERIPDYQWRATWAQQLLRPSTQLLYKRTRANLPSYLRCWLRDQCIVSTDPITTDCTRAWWGRTFSIPDKCCSRAYRPEHQVTCDSLRRRQEPTRCQGRTCNCSASTWVFPTVATVILALLVALVLSVWYWNSFAYEFYPKPVVSQTPVPTEDQPTSHGTQEERRAMLYVRSVTIFLGLVLFFATLTGVLQQLQVMEAAVRNSVAMLERRLRDCWPYSYRMWYEVFVHPCDNGWRIADELENENDGLRLLFESTYMDALFQYSENIVMGQWKIDPGDCHYLDQYFAVPRINWGWRNKRDRLALPARDFIDRHFYRPRLVDDFAISASTLDL